MLTKETQISAVVSASTRDLLDRHVRATGLKKGYLMEQALRHHLLALEQIPAEYIVKPKMVVDKDSGKAILAADLAEPTQALRDLMRDGN